MPILNYTTKIEAAKTASEIMALLTRKGVTEILTQYSNEGEIQGLQWRYNTGGGPLTYAMPVNVEGVFRVMTNQNIIPGNELSRRAQAKRTAWRNSLHWTQSQLAMVEAGQAELEEVFLPYTVLGDRTLYRAIAEAGFSVLPPAVTSPQLPPGNPDTGKMERA